MRWTRIMLAAAACASGGASEAATVFAGTLSPLGGLAVLASEAAWPPGGLAEGERVRVSFAIDQGVIASVLGTVQYRWSYDIVSGDPAALPFGNDIDGSETCSFSGAGPDGCHDSSDPATPLAARFITNLVVGPQSLSYDLFRPAGFDICDTVVDSICRSQWSVTHDFAFTVAGSAPVGYRLSFADPAAVPEPASWAMLVAGFALVGGTLRRRRPPARVCA